MRVLVEGSGGAAGWPQPGCRCASCLRVGESIRVRSTIVVDGVLRLGVEGAGGGDAGTEGEAGDAGAEGEAGDAGAEGEARGGDAGGYRVRRLADARDAAGNRGLGRDGTGRGAAAVSGAAGGGAGAAGGGGGL